MSSMVLSGDTSGQVTLTVPAVAGTNTITLPAATGTVMVSGNMPAFSAYAGSNQSLSSSTVTKVQINTKEFDTANAYDSTTNYRFTPQVAGYYQVNGLFTLSAAVQTVQAYIYKNGSSFKLGSYSGSGGTYLNSGQVSALIYLNGSTDYIEFYAQTGVNSTITSGVANTYFQAVIIRSA